MRVLSEALKSNESVKDVVRSRHHIPHREFVDRRELKRRFDTSVDGCAAKRLKRRCSSMVPEPRQ
jgi:hypothetical protein